MTETQVPELLIDVYDNRVRAGAFVSAAAAFALQHCFPPTTERSLFSIITKSSQLTIWGKHKTTIEASKRSTIWVLLAVIFGVNGVVAFLLWFVVGKNAFSESLLHLRHVLMFCAFITKQTGSRGMRSRSARQWMRGIPTGGTW